MKYTRNLDGISRLKTVRTYYPGSNCYPTKQFKAPKESEDTKIRKDIYKTIITMMSEKKGNVEIEIFLRNKYPNYVEYIPKVVNDQFKKHELRKGIEPKVKENGDER